MSWWSGLWWLPPGNRWVRTSCLCSTDYWSFTQPNRALPFDLFLLSVGVLLSLVADVKNRFPPNFVKLVCSAMSFLFGDNAATKTSTYTLAADATVKIDVLDPTAGA